MRLTASPYPYVLAEITIGSWSIVEPVYLDTGHEGGLLIPAELEHDVWAESELIRLRVADGAVVRAPAWSGSITIEAKTFSGVEIVAMGPRFLLGRDVLDQMTVCFVRGQEVRLEF